MCLTVILFTSLKIVLSLIALSDWNKGWRRNQYFAVPCCKVDGWLVLGLCFLSLFLMWGKQTSVLPRFCLVCKHVATCWQAAVIQALDRVNQDGNCTTWRAVTEERGEECENMDGLEESEGTDSHVFLVTTLFCLFYIFSGCSWSWWVCCLGSCAFAFPCMLGCLLKQG